MFRSSVSQSSSTQFITHATYRRATYILSHVQHSLSSSPSPTHSLPPPHFSSFPHDSPSSSPSPFLFDSSFSLSPLYFSLFSASLPVSLLIPFSLLSFIELKYTLVLDEQEARVGLMEQDGQFGSNMVVRNITIPEPDRQQCEEFTLALRVSHQCRARGYWYDLGHTKDANGLFELT